MRHNMEEGDFLDRASRLTGSLDAVSELLGGQNALSTIMPAPMAYLIDLLACEAHALLDEERDDADEARPPRGVPLRTVRAND